MYSYHCENCDIKREVLKPMAKCSETEHCDCGDEMRKLIDIVAITGTADNFGIKKAFFDERTGQEITNFKQWEKAGYKDVESISNPVVKKKAKEKAKRCHHRGERQFSNDILV